MSSRPVLLAAALLALAACGNDSRYEVEIDAPPGVTDERVPVPDSDDSMLYFVTPEAVIQPGEEKMWCVYVENKGDDAAIDWIDGKQGAYGHHISLMASNESKPPGTMFDCTDAETNKSLRWFAFNVTFPAGDAMLIPHGQSFVVQFHYINSGETPILVRDIERMHKVDKSSVKHWVSSMIASDLDVTVAPGPTMDEWDCTVPQDVEVLELFGHMHENGTKFTLDTTQPGESKTRFYSIDPYLAQYRDAPKVVQYFDHPLLWKAGTVVHPHCEWLNGTAQSLPYPYEMCMLFAYVRSETSTQCTPQTHSYVPL